jgi:hypothetical protein
MSWLWRARALQCSRHCLTLAAHIQGLTSMRHPLYSVSHNHTRELGKPG